jgi:hypothetical protein
MFSKTPTGRNGNASPSVSILTLGLKLADIIDTGSSMYNCTQILCFHMSYAPLIAELSGLLNLPFVRESLVWLIRSEYLRSFLTYKLLIDICKYFGSLLFHQEPSPLIVGIGRTNKFLQRNVNCKSNQGKRLIYTLFYSLLENIIIRDQSRYWDPRSTCFPQHHNFHPSGNSPHFPLIISSAPSDT